MYSCCSSSDHTAPVLLTIIAKERGSYELLIKVREQLKKLNIGFKVDGIFDRFGELLIIFLSSSHFLYYYYIFTFSLIVFYHIVLPMVVGTTTSTNEPTSSSLRPTMQLILITIHKA